VDVFFETRCINILQYSTLHTMLTYAVSHKKLNHQLLPHQSLTDFRNSFTAGKSVKFSTNRKKYFPPHTKHVTALHWELKKFKSVEKYKDTT